MKKNYHLRVQYHPNLKKLIMELKITILIVLVSVTNIFASNTYSQTAKVTLNMENKTLEQVMDEIEQQSEFYFIFNQKQIDVNRRVNVQVDSKLINEILPDLFTGTDVNYTVLDRKILLTTDPIMDDLTINQSVTVLQQNLVTGTVTDTSTGDPMPGVNIVVKGTNIGTLSAINGTYSINVSELDAVLTFSFIGYISQEILLSGRTIIDVRLVPSIEALEEVVVVGYGTQTKKTLTGAVSSIQANDITSTIHQSVSGALIGKIAGITTRIADGRPGRAATLQIRNFGTPLYIIDGVPATEADFNNMEATNIESISILKDASSAIYGLLASNGVVLVTTKLGKITEKPIVNISGYYGLQGFTRFPQPANSYYYMLGIVESNQNRGIQNTITQEMLNKYKTGFYDPSTGEDYRSFDYLDYTIGRNTPSPQKFLNVSTSGATENSNYYFSVSHLDQKSVIEDYNYSRYNVQANLETKVIKRLKVGTQISARYELDYTAAIPGGDDYVNVFKGVMVNWPIERPYANDNPRYVNRTHVIRFNPATYKRDIQGWSDQYYRIFRGNVYSEYDFGFGLKARATFSYGYNTYKREVLEGTWPTYTYDRASDTYNISEWRLTVYRQTDRRLIEDIFGQLSLNYNKKIGKHTISSVLAYEQGRNDNQLLILHTIPPNNYIPIQLFEDADKMTNTWDQSARASYIGRLNYNFDEKYLVELLGRYDGSYLYSPGKRWGLFPGISIGWRISNETFFSPLTNIFSEVKLRGSWGQTGSEIGVSPYDFMEGFNWGVQKSVLEGATVTGIQPRGLPVTNLSWVTVITSNIGLDISFLDGRVNSQFDLFERRVSGIPAARYDVLLPSEVGYTLPNENLNTSANRGIEGIVDYHGKVGKVNFVVGVNATLARQRNIETYKPRFGNSWDEYRNSTEDRWSNISWGYHIIGQFQSQQEIADYPVNIDGSGNRTLLPGDLIYEDLNGDKIINVMDMKPIGYATGANPYMSFGLTNSFDYKRINLVVNFAGGTMQSWIRNNELKIPFYDNGNSPTWLLEDRWHRADPFDPNSEWIPGANPPTRKDYTSHSNFNKTNDLYLTNVSYLRVRDLELGYTVATKILQKISVSKLRVYINMSNLFSIDNVGKKFGTDPEITLASGLVYPITRVYTFGFALTL